MASLQTYRIQTAKGLGGYEDRGVRSASGGRLTTAVGTDASLFEQRWPILRGRLENDFYTGAALYRTGVGASGALPAADRVRQIGPEGHSGQEGKFIPDSNWVLAPTSGEEYELHLHGFDPYQQLTDLINQALRAITLIVDVYFVLERDARGSYVPELDADGNDLSVWLTAPAQLLSIRSQATPGPLMAVNWNDTGRAMGYRGGAWSTGDRLYLTASGGLAGSAVWAQCYKPAYFHCAPASGIVGEQSGLTPGSETDAAVPDPEWVAAGAVALAWESFDDMESAAQRIKGLRYQAAKAAFYQRQQDYYAQRRPDRSYVPYGALV